MLKYSDSEILAAIEREESQSYQTTSGTLKQERDESLDYYLGEDFGNEQPDRSSVVTRDVLDTIEWVLPSLLKTFLAGEEIIKINPVGVEDIPQAEQETQVINHIIQQKNPGFNIFYTWFKDALLQKTGYVAAYWEVKEEYPEERYEGLTEDELAYILTDSSLEVIENDAYGDVYGNILYTIKVRKTVPCKQVRIVNIPPEEMYVSTRTRSVSLKDAPFVEHRCYKTISDLRSAGYELDMTKMSGYSDIEDENRDIYDETGPYSDDQAEESMRNVLVRDCYVRIDDNNDGIAELKRILIAGSQILEREEADFIPFAAICPIPMTHRHIGLSYADLVMDLQLIKSTITRQILDNMYLSNNVRMAVDPSRVNLDDMLQNRPGGIVRTIGDPAGAMLPLVNPPIYSNSFGMLEYIDSMRENRTGITKYNQGMDSNSLNKTATGINAIMGQSAQRIELVARLFAEGVKELFWMVHALQSKHADSVETVELRGKYVAVDPRGWKKRTDFGIGVGLGTGNKQEMASQLMLILQAQREAIQIGIATPKNIHYALTKLTQNAGFKDADSFWTDPSEGGVNPGLPPEVQQQIEQGMQVIQLQKEEIDKLKANIAKMQSDASVEVYKADKSADTQVAIAKANNDTKQMISLFETAVDALVQSQQQLEQRMMGLESMNVDLTPVIEAVQNMMREEHSELTERD